MSPRTEAATAFLRSPWWPLVLVAFSVGGWVTLSGATNARQDREIAGKADTVTMREIRDDVRAIREGVDSANRRLAQVLCDGKPRYCR